MRLRFTIKAVLLLSVVSLNQHPAAQRFVSGQQRQREPFSYVIDRAILLREDIQARPGERAERIATLYEPKGARQDFVVDEVIFALRNDRELNDLLSTYNGRVVDDGTIPPLPPGTTIYASAPSPPATTGFVVVKVDLKRAPLNRLVTNANKLGAAGQFRYSSEDAARLTAIIAEERVRGRDIGFDLLFQPDSTRHPCVSPNSYENVANPSAPNASLPNLGFTDGFALAWLNDRDIEVTDAWARLDRSGHANQRVLLFVIDAGFAPNADFRSTAFQYNFANNTFNATGANPVNCSGTPCPWHGTQVFSTAGAVINNRFGAAGTGGQVVEPVLFFTRYRRSEETRAVQAAISWSRQLGVPGVINMSFSGHCGTFCSIEGLDDALLNAAGQGIIPIAAAGNDNEEVQDEDVVPCRESGVICVGAIGSDKRRAGFSNFGNRVDIWAPGVGLVTTPIPNANGTPGTTLSSFGGTSAASPFVAGIVAMMKAINPSIGRNQVRDILRGESVRSSDAQVSPGFVNAFGSVRRTDTAPPVLASQFIGTGVKWHGDFGFGNEFVAVGDFNGDCRDDIVAFTKGSSGQVFVALSVGSEFVGTGQLWGSSFCLGSQICAVGDFNGDGRDDLASFDQDTGTVQVSLSLGSSFDVPAVWSSSFSRCRGQTILVGNFGGPRAGEFGRGFDDIAVFVRGSDPSTLAPGESRGEVYVALSDGTSFGPRTRWHDFFAPGPESVASGDFNADGFNDVLAFLQDCCPEPDRGDVFVARAAGTAFSPSEKWNDFFSIGAEVPAVGDFDGDGRFDVATFVRNAPTNIPGLVIVGRSTTASRFDFVGVWHRSFCFGSEICGTGDFNGDGRSDVIAFTRGATGDVFVALSSPGP